MSQISGKNAVQIAQWSSLRLGSQEPRFDTPCVPGDTPIQCMEPHSILWTWNGLGMLLSCFCVRFLTCFGWMLDIFWTCLRYFLDMFGTCLGQFFDMFKTCVGHCLDMVWTIFGYVLEMIWTCFGHAFDEFRPICWTSLGQTVVIRWNC